MSIGLRSWLFAVTILLLAEDFQYLLKIEGYAFEITKSEKIAGCGDCEDNDGGKEEREEEKNEEKKEEKKEKDDDNNVGPDDLMSAGALLAKHKFRDVLAPLSAIAHDLESPPPEV